MGIAKKIVNRPVLGIVIFGLVAVVALYLVSGVAVDMFPEIDMPILMVSTSYSGAGPETVEKSVTKSLESSLVNIGGLSSITSTSAEGQSVIVLEFNYGVNLDNKTNDVRDRLDRVRRLLPDEAGTPIIMQFDPSAMPIMRIAVRGDRGQNELRSLATELVQDRLEQIDGVAAASVMGGQDGIVKVELSQNRLEAYGLSITGIARTLAAANLELGAGSIVENATNYSIRTSGEYGSLRDIEATVVARRSGADIRLGDVASVSLGFPEESSTTYINGESGVYVSVTKQSGANSVSVANSIYTRLEEIGRLLPGGISLAVVEDDTVQIRDMINELVNSALLGAALAMGILFIFLRNIKSTIIIGISIPFSILVTLLVMSLAGITLNMLTMTGLILGVGMIVDSSIVILENIFKYREKGETPGAAAILGSDEVISSIVSSTLTTVCVFLPIMLFKNQLGMMGELFQGLIFTVGIALVSSLLVALFLVPILASTYLPLNTRVQKPLKNRVLIATDSLAARFFAALDRGYSRLLAAALRHRLMVTFLVIAAFAGALLAVPKMGIALIPPMQEDSVILNVTMPLGTTYEDTRAVMLQLQDFAIGEINGARTVIADVGSSGGFMGFSSASGAGNEGQLSIQLDLNESGADTNQAVMEKLRAHYDDFPGAVMAFDGGRTEMLSGGADIDIAIRYDEIDTGLAAAADIADLIRAGIPELEEVSIDLKEGLPQVEVVIDRDRASDLGLSISGIASEIAASMNGVTATSFRHAGTEYSVVLELRAEDREKLPDLERIFVPASSGALVRLSNVASLEKGLGPVNIKRENQSRVIHITGSITRAPEGAAGSGRSAGQVESRIKTLLDENYLLPEGISLSYEGQWREITKTIKTFILIVTLAILLVFGVMAGQYESFKDPLINLCTIPLLVIGVVLVYLFTGQTLSAFSLVGVVMLAGIVVNNGIVLVDYTNLLTRRGMPVREACRAAGVSRLRPVLMTTLTTVLGLVPMAFFPGASSGLIQPIGLTVIGGLASSTLITLFFIPVVYSLISGQKAPRSN
jgi:HAE1 family hydrophobic/amphiphilic exporter-1